MSAALDSLLDAGRRADCARHDAAAMCCTHRCREGRDCPLRRQVARRPRPSLLAGLRPLYREAAIFFYRWAAHDLQQKDPHHRDLPLILNRLVDLRAERMAPGSLERRAYEWL